MQPILKQVLPLLLSTFIGHSATDPPAPNLAPVTHVVRVGPDGSFSPPQLRIRDGDTVEWVLSHPSDSIVPATGRSSWPAICANLGAYDQADPNEFTGPLPDAPAGVFALSPIPLDAAFAASPNGACAVGDPVARGDGGEVLCRGEGVAGATMDSTWRSPSITGVFIRLLWNDVNPAPGVYDFGVLDREVDQAVANGKLYSLAFKAGKHGTPSWIFAHGVTPLTLQDGGAKLAQGRCGATMQLGSPTDPHYQRHYLALLSAVASHLKARADRYRALAYIKPSGANLYTHENRLPRRCKTDEGCLCNTKILARAGYRPSGLVQFYEAQLGHLAAEFPGKAVAYALIQAGFPMINEAGGFQRSDGGSSDGRGLPGPFAQTQAILDLGQSRWPARFVVQHNGLGPAPSAATCPNRLRHPVPLRGLGWYGAPGSGCPSRWVLREGAQGQRTAFQTNNGKRVGTSAELESTFQNLIDNSDGIFLEVYEERLWEAEHNSGGVLDATASGRTLGQWRDALVARRPPPLVHRHTFTRTLAGKTPQSFPYVHGSKCGAAAANHGVVIVD